MKCFDVGKPKWMNHLWRRQKDQGRGGRGNPMWLRSCQVIIFLEETTEWNIRWYQIRVLTGATVALLLVVFVRDGVRRTGVSSPDLLFGQWVITQIRLISWRTERKTQKKLDESDPVAAEVSDIKPQDHRNMQHNAWKTYAEERVKYKLLSLNSTVRNTSPINEQTDSRAKSF